MDHFRKSLDPVEMWVRDSEIDKRRDQYRDGATKSIMTWIQGVLRARRDLTSRSSVFGLDLQRNWALREFGKFPHASSSSAGRPRQVAADRARTGEKF